MYRRFASSKKGWSFEMLSESLNAEGGLKEASAGINGSSVFAHMKVRIPSLFFLLFFIMLWSNLASDFFTALGMNVRLSIAYVFCFFFQRVFYVSFLKK